MTKSALILLCGLFGSHLYLQAQSLDYSGPVSSSLAFTKVFDDSPWASLNNIASLAQHNQLSVGAAYQMRFNMEELSARAATVVFPSRYGTFAALVFQNGYSKSNYSRYALSYSRVFGHNLQSGFQLI